MARLCRSEVSRSDSCNSVSLIFSLPDHDDSDRQQDSQDFTPTSSGRRCLDYPGPSSIPSLVGAAPKSFGTSVLLDLSLSSYPLLVPSSTSSSPSSSTPSGALLRLPNWSRSGRVPSILGVAKVSLSCGASFPVTSPLKPCPRSSVSSASSRCVIFGAEWLTH